MRLHVFLFLCVDHGRTPLLCSELTLLHCTADLRRNRFAWRDDKRTRPTQRAAHCREARCGNLLKDRHHEAERTSLVSLLLCEIKTVLQILAELGIVGAIIFFCFLLGIARLGFAEIRKHGNDCYNILTHAAAAGICAFLISSFFSSFSFRLMQNGLVFFFLLAILLRKQFRAKAEKQSLQSNITPATKFAFASISLVLCLSLTVFSALKATSQYLVYQGERESDLSAAQTYFERAALLDPANPSANISYGLRLLNENRYPESAAQLRRAVDKGLNTSVSYSYLITAQTLSNDLKQAEKTSAEAVRIFPFSVFTRVRHAYLLEKLHLTEESVKQYESARELDKKQAETWRILINNGALAASERAKTGEEILNLMELHPQPALYAVLTERELLYPEEKAKFNFRR